MARLECVQVLTTTRSSNVSTGLLAVSNQPGLSWKSRRLCFGCEPAGLRTRSRSVPWRFVWPNWLVSSVRRLTALKSTAFSFAGRFRPRPTPRTFWLGSDLGLRYFEKYGRWSGVLDLRQGVRSGYLTRRLSPIP